MEADGSGAGQSKVDFHSLVCSSGHKLLRACGCCLVDEHRPALAPGTSILYFVFILKTILAFHIHCNSELAAFK